MPAEPLGKVLAIALKTAAGGPMREVDRAVAETNGVLRGSAPATPRRGVTFLSAQQWTAVLRELKADIPWHTRRANVLIDCDSFQPFLGRTIQLGAAKVELIAETRPCKLMDELHPGLLAALKPDMRAGVFGRIVEGGEFHVGDVAKRNPDD